MDPGNINNRIDRKREKVLDLANIDAGIPFILFTLNSVTNKSLISINANDQKGIIF